MSDGSVWEFGTLDSKLTHKALNAKFFSEFTATPLVFLSVEANNNSALSPAIVNKVTPQGFVYTLESNSAEFLQQTDAKVHYMAYLPPVEHGQGGGILALPTCALPYQVYRASVGGTEQLIGGNRYYYAIARW